MKSLFVILTFLFHLPLVFAADSSIAYSSVSNALERLKSNPAATVEKKQDWTVISVDEDGHLATWFFPPEVHGTRSAVFKKLISSKGNGVETQVVSLCEAPKAECDEVARQFKQINNK